MGDKNKTGTKWSPALSAKLTQLVDNKKIVSTTTPSQLLTSNDADFQDFKNYATTPYKKGQLNKAIKSSFSTESITHSLNPGTSGFFFVSF